MELQPIKINLIIAWLWILLGFLSGFVMGLQFHKENWLGGYGSFQRRMYRLAHISFFGLAAVNWMFYVTAQEFAVMSQSVTLASWTFVAGAVTMPLCCVLMAHWPPGRWFFGVPVLNLLVAGALTLWEVVKL